MMKQTILPLLIAALALLPACGDDSSGTYDAGDDCGYSGSKQSQDMPCYQQALDLDTGTKHTCAGGNCASDPDVSTEPWDFMFVNSEPFVRPHFELGAEAAFLNDVSFDEVTDCEIEDALWKGETLGQKLTEDDTTVVLVRTDQGAIFKIGEVVVDESVEFDYSIYFRYAALTQ